MNVMYTNDNPILAAREHCLVHRRKMIIEHVQMMCTGVRLSMSPTPELVYIKSYYGSRLVLKKKYWHTAPSDVFVYKFGMKILVDKVLYGVTHQNHPTACWIRWSSNNFEWVQICTEELIRLQGTHRSSRVLEEVVKYKHLLKSRGFERPPASVVDEFKSLPVLEAYHAHLNKKYSDWLNRDLIIKVEFEGKIPSWSRYGSLI